jgi:hypothetical protein
MIWLASLAGLRPLGFLALASFVMALVFRGMTTGGPIMKRPYLITYDIVENKSDDRTVEDRMALVEKKLRGIGGIIALDRQWAVVFDGQGKELRDFVKENFGLSDRCTVVEVVVPVESWWTIEPLNDFNSAL